MPRDSFVAFLIINEMNKIKKGYCVNCKYLHSGICEQKRDVKKCLRKNLKEVGGNEDESKSYKRI